MLLTLDTAARQQFPYSEYNQSQYILQSCICTIREVPPEESANYRSYSHALGAMSLIGSEEGGQHDPALGVLIPSIFAIESLQNNKFSGA